MKYDLAFPSPSEIPSSLLSFLEKSIRNREDLLNCDYIVSDLQDKCSTLDSCIANLHKQLLSKIAAHTTHSKITRDALDGMKHELDDGISSIEELAAFSDGGENQEKEWTLTTMATLAKEISKLKTLTTYAEAALKLDTLVGQIEDLVSSCTSGARKPSIRSLLEDLNFLAIKSLRQAEDILISITKGHPKWFHLVSSVDHRIDHALALLRPHMIADHRSFLALLGWPPPLSASLPSKSSSQMCPLLSADGSLKADYCASFLNLCYLQLIHIQRKSRNSQTCDQEVFIHEPLWVIEELARAVILAAEQILSKWKDKPEFIFALLHKIIRDFIDSLAEMLQPLIDQARLVGYGCREEWISAIVQFLIAYLSKDMFPNQLALLAEDNENTSSNISLLHLIDLMIAFDKKNQSHILCSGVLFTEESFQRISSLSLFCHQPDWLNVWAELELTDLLENLRQEISDERNWKTFCEVGLGSFMSPVISTIFLKHLSVLVDRCKMLPIVSLRETFFRLVGVPIVHEFLDCVLRRCQEAEGLTALAEDNALCTVAYSIDAARYFGSVLGEWCEDIFFLEMKSDHINAGEDEIYFLYEESIKLEMFCTEWVKKISSAVFRGFDAACREYIKNKKQWQDDGERGYASEVFIVALDYLQGKLAKLQGILNETDFTSVWRNLADLIDHLVFDAILMGGIRFSKVGTERFGGDLELMFELFGAWCLRPQGFFPKLTESLILLKMDDGKMISKMNQEHGWWRKNGVKQLREAEVSKIMRSRCFED